MKYFVSLIMVLLLAMTMFPSSLVEAQDIPEDYGSMEI